MDYRTIRTLEFEEAYDEIIGYLVHELQSPSAATHLMKEVERIANLLEATPMIHAISQKSFLCERNLREYFFMNYVIVYKVENNTVVFVNLFHQAQNYNSESYWTT